MSFLDFLFPKRCVSCEKLGSYICPDCFVKIKPIETPICPVCTRPAIHGLTHPRCQGRLRLDGLVCLFSYQGPIKVALKKIKFSSIFDLVPELARLALEDIEESEVLYKFFVEKKPLVVPIPLHWFRQNERGFNQSAFFGKQIAQRWGLSFGEDILKREKYTLPQAKLKKKERKGNIQGVFKTNEGFSPNFLISQFPNILLIDDIWTTGATMREAGKVLKRAGAKKVLGLTLAR